jgi:hypothetical protein
MLPPGYSFVEVDEDNGEIRRKPRRGKKGGLQRSQSAHAGLGGRGRGRGGDDDDGFQGQTAGSTAAQKKRDSLSRVDSKSYQRYREANSIRRGPGPDENASRGLITSIADPPPPRVGVPSGGGPPGPGSGGGSRARAHHNMQPPRRAHTMSVLAGSSTESDYELAQRLQHEEDMAAAQHHDESKASALSRTRSGGGGSARAVVGGSSTRPNPSVRTTGARDHVVTRAPKDVCCICLDDISIGGKATTLRCSHTFHQRCIMKWFKSQGDLDGSGVTTARKCPMCNATQ